MGIPIPEEIQHRQRLKRHTAIQEEMDRRKAAADEEYKEKLKMMSDEDLQKEYDRVLTEPCE